jgi:surfactin synthase thioesterase subunit
MPASAWIVRFQERPDAAVRLLCLPHAGGGASPFRLWSRALDPQIEVDAVQLPGRETRIREPLRHDLASLADELADELAGLTRRPYALYGHSMGALLAFELAHRLERTGRPPARVFVAGCGAPHRHPLRSRLHLMPFEDVVAELRRHGVTPEPVLRDRALMERLVPILQADIAMCVDRAPSIGGPIAAPISVFGGRADTVVPPATLPAWAELTRARRRVELFDGGHFFPAQARDEVLEAISAGLEEAVSAWPMLA